MPGISVFFPAFNDGGTIASMVILASATLKKVTDDFEIIVVDDGSVDSTADVLQELQKNLTHLKVVHHGANMGYGAALITGFSNCCKEYIFYTDGDAQYDVRELPLLLAEMKDGIDWVNGYKIVRSDPLHRKILGRIYHWIAKIVFDLKLRDVDCDFRLIRRSVFERVALESTDGVICVEMIKKFQDIGFRVKEVPVHHYFRAYGKSQFFNFPRIFRIANHLIKLWWNLRIKKSHRSA